MQTQLSCATCGAPFEITRTSGKPRRFCSRTCQNKRPVKARISLADRFWRHVDRRGPDECWPWLGATVGSYGVFGVGGSAAKGGYQTTAHRVALALSRGVPVEEIGPVVRHSCDWPPCQNPSHLNDGTQKKNLDDMRQKGRRGRTGPPGGQLTAEAVRVIRYLYARGYSTQTELAAAHGVHQTVVSKVVRRVVWQHVE